MNKVKFPNIGKNHILVTAGPMFGRHLTNLFALGYPGKVSRLDYQQGQSLALRQHLIKAMIRDLKPIVVAFGEGIYDLMGLTNDIRGFGVNVASASEYARAMGTIVEGNRPSSILSRQTQAILEAQEGFEAGQIGVNEGLKTLGIDPKTIVPTDSDLAIREEYMGITTPSNQILAGNADFMRFYTGHPVVVGLEKPHGAVNLNSIPHYMPNEREWVNIMSLYLQR